MGFLFLVLLLQQNALLHQEKVANESLQVVSAPVQVPYTCSSFLKDDG